MGLSSKQVSSDKTLEYPNTSPMIKTQQQQHEPLNCPRCDSINTKFCYYNNYNKSQPRHFCKACKRHWTKGGTLRNVPVGGGRKNKRLKTSKPASKTTTTTLNNTNVTLLQPQQLRVGPPFVGSLISDSVIEGNNFSKAFYHNFLNQQPCSLPPTSITFNSKGLKDGITTATATTSLGISQYHDYDDQEIQLPYSNLGSFEDNPCSISSTIAPIQSPILYNFTGDHEINGGLLEEPRNNTNNINNSGLEMCSNNWGNWDDFDKFECVEADLTIPWDDSEFKTSNLEDSPNT